MKLVINKCFGGYGLSIEAAKALAKLKNQPVFFYVHDRAMALTLEEQRKEFVSGKRLIKIPKRTYKRITKLVNPDDLFYELCEDLGETCSEKALEKCFKKSVRYNDWDRNDPDLVKVVEKLGAKANGTFADLKVVEIPDGTDWEIEEYDGMERVSQKHETWG